MMVKGELKCLHCGFVGCQWVGERGAHLTVAGIPVEQRQPGADEASAARCQRCDGPVFLDDVEPVISSHRLRRIRRLREQIAAMDARRGRAA